MDLRTDGRTGHYTQIWNKQDKDRKKKSRGALKGVGVGGKTAEQYKAKLKRREIKTRIEK